MKAINIPAEAQTLIDEGALVVVNHSGGKDSQAMTLAIQAMGIPAAQVLVIHAELPEADWDGIKEHIEGTLPAEWTQVIYTKAGKTFFEMVERRFESRPEVPSFPSAQTRQCTSDLKRDPISKVVRHFLKDHPEFNGKVVHVMGIRAEESSSRAKAVTWKLNKRESKAGRQVMEWLPIHDWLIEDVKAAVSEAGQELHWAYAAGMSRLSCCFCIMGSKKDMKTAAALRPDLAARYVALEEKTGYTMSMDQTPLKVIIGS